MLRILPCNVFRLLSAFNLYVSEQPAASHRNKFFLNLNCYVRANKGEFWK